MVDFRVGAKMDRLGIDILGPFPMTTKGNRCLCIIVDYFMRCVEVFPLPDYSAKTIMHSLVHEFVCRFWAPLEIHTDQGRNFEVLCFTKYVDFLTSTKTAPHHTTPAPTVWWRGSIARWRLSFGAKPPPPSTYPQKILKKSLKTLQHGNQPGEVSNIFIIHLIIIIKSEVSTFPIVVIFFHGCVSEMVVLPYSVIYYIYISGTLGPCFNYLCSVYWCSVYCICKRLDTLWPAGRVRLCADYTISLSSSYRLIWRHWTNKMLVRYMLLSVCQRLRLFSQLSFIH